MQSHHHIQRPARGRSFGEAVRLLAINQAPLQVLRDAEILVDAGTGFLVRWHLSGGPWPAHGPAAIGALRGFHHGILAPGAAWPMHIHGDLQAVTYVVEGALVHSDSLGKASSPRAACSSVGSGGAPSTTSGTRRRPSGWSSFNSGWRHPGQTKQR